MLHLYTIDNLFIPGPQMDNNDDNIPIFPLHYIFLLNFNSRDYVKIFY